MGTIAQPSFSPDTVNQHVQVGDELWIGNPGQGWHIKTYSPDELQRQQVAAAMNAIQPAVDSLNAGLPEVAQKFDTARGQAEAQRNPLIERYNNLISDLRASESGQVAETQNVAAREMGRRGIPLSSTFASEETLRRTQPIHQATDTNVRDVSLDREDKLRQLDDLIANLTQDQVAAERDIRNTIANLQANASTGALDRAMQEYQIQEQSRQAALDRALQERQIAAGELAASKPTNIITEANGRKYLLTYDNSGNIISKQDLGSSGSGTGTSGITIGSSNTNLGSTTQQSNTQTKQQPLTLTSLNFSTNPLDPLYKSDNLLPNIANYAKSIVDKETQTSRMNTAKTALEGITPFKY